MCVVLHRVDSLILFEEFPNHFIILNLFDGSLWSKSSDMQTVLEAYNWKDKS